MSRVQVARISVRETNGAADALGGLITTGMGIRKSLDALVNNLFKGNATVIGEWVAASHVERQGSRTAKPERGRNDACAET